MVVSKKGVSSKNKLKWGLACYTWLERSSFRELSSISYRPMKILTIQKKNSESSTYENIKNSKGSDKISKILNINSGRLNCSVLSYTYISIKYRPYNSDYQLKHGQIAHLYLLGGNTSVTNQEVLVLTSSPSKYKCQFGNVLTNNLNFEGQFLIDICVSDDTDTSVSILKTLRWFFF